MMPARRFFLVICHFVCPLIFFTNLTRNPYITQIVFLNICLLLAAASYIIEPVLEGAPLRMPKTPIDLPLLAFFTACVCSWMIAYWKHAAFFRPSMRSEGLVHFIFLITNALIPFYLAASVASGEERDPALQESVAHGGWIAFVIIWGALWMLFPQARGRPGPSADIWSQVLDGYGLILWMGGLGAVLWLCRRGRTIDYFHLAFATGFLAAVYAVFQYFNVEFIWPHVLNPYGGRSVSTFGNPNFMSSYIVMLLPMVLALFVLTEKTAEKLVYAVVFSVLEAALLCSLTRSSWLGAAVGISLLALSPELRTRILANPKPCGLLIIWGILMAGAWPQSSIAASYSSSVVGRAIEMVTSLQHGGRYSPWHQRVLIWTCSWLMGAENPLTGKGWGLFELFYPFYQGHVLDLYDLYQSMRTHANNSHNLFLEVWAQTGLLGLGFFSWILVTMGTTVHQWSKRFLGGRALWYGVAAGLAGMLVDNLLNVSLYFAVTSFLFWWLAGALMGGAAYECRGAWRIIPATVGRVAGTVLACILVIFSWYWVCVWNREVHYFAGFKLLRQGAMAAATRQLEISRDWGPREVNAVYELGNAYARNQNFEAARRIYGQALDANAGYDEIYYNIATLEQNRLGHLDQALLYYRAALAINPLSPEIYSGLSAIYLADPHRWAREALPVLQRAVHFFPDNASFWSNIGYYYATLGRDERAAQAYERALRVAPDLATAERNLSALTTRHHMHRPLILDELSEMRALELRVSRQDYSEGTLALATRAVTNFPDLPRPRFIFGSLLLALHRPIEAVAPLEWVVARAPSLVAAHLNLSSVYNALGRSADARRELQMVLSIDPNNEAARRILQSLPAL